MKQLLLFISFIALVASCTPERNELAGKISTLEISATAPQKTLDKAIGEELFENYEDFFEYYPQDTLVPEMLFKGGQIAMLYGQNMRVSEYFEKLIKDFPQYKKTTDAYVILGNFYANKIYDLERANAVYDAFLVKYPNHELTPQIEFLKLTLGKTSDEILELIQKKNM